MPKPRKKVNLGEPAGVCGCSAEIIGTDESTGRGRRAAGVDSSIKAANLTHLRRIEGQIRGISAMVEGDRYCADIITQVSAVRESLHAVARNLMRNHLNHCVAEAMREGGKTRKDAIEEVLELVAKIVR